jgi:hypothetical protein
MQQKTAPNPEEDLALFVLSVLTNEEDCQGTGACM